MRIAVLGALVSLVLGHPMAIGAAGYQEQIEWTDAVGMRIRVTGVLASYGTEPHTYFAVLVSPSDPRDVVTAGSARIRVDDEQIIRIDTGSDPKASGQGNPDQTDTGPSIADRLPTDDIEADIRAAQGERVVLTGVLMLAPEGPGRPAILQIQEFRVLK